MRLDVAKVGDYKPRGLAPDRTSKDTISRVAGDTEGILNTAASFLDAEGSQVSISSVRDINQNLLAASFSLPNSPTSYTYATRGALVLLLENNTDNPTTQGCRALVPDTGVLKEYFEVHQKNALLIKCRQGIMECVTWTYN